MNDITSTVPQMKTEGPSTAIASAAVSAPAGEPALVHVEAYADHDGGHERRGERGEGEDGLHQVAQASGSVGLDEHADQRRAEDDQQRRQQAVADLRSLEVGHWCASSSA